MRHHFAAMPLLIAATLLLDAATAQVMSTSILRAMHKSHKTIVAPRAGALQAFNTQSAAPERQPSMDDAARSEAASASPQDQSSRAPLSKGAWNVPGAPKDSQTVPAKFSSRNAALDKLPIVAQMLWLTDAQRKQILASVQASKAPVIKLTANVTSELPGTVSLHALPQPIETELPNTSDLKFVRLQDKVLLVYAPNWIVVDEIKH